VEQAQQAESTADDHQQLAVQIVERTLEEEDEPFTRGQAGNTSCPVLMLQRTPSSGSLELKTSSGVRFQTSEKDQAVPVQPFREVAVAMGGNSHRSIRKMNHNIKRIPAVLSGSPASTSFGSGAGSPASLSVSYRKWDAVSGDLLSDSSWCLIFRVIHVSKLVDRWQCLHGRGCDHGHPSLFPFNSYRFLPRFCVL
jgi:hypothetical protein